jgi:hypothetical protein
MSAKINHRVFKAGKVLAPDSKWTGEEPDWFGWEKWPVEQFMRTRMRMLQFYGYYLTSADLKPAVLAYMKTHKYGKEDIALVQGANPNLMPTTIGKLVRAIDRGMPSLHPQAEEYFASLPFHDPEFPPTPKDDHAVIRAELHKVLVFLRDVKKEDADLITTASKTPTPNPLERLRNKVEKEVIAPLEAMFDIWCEKWDTTKVEPLSLTSYIRDGAIPAAGCKFINEWLNKRLVEYQGAYNKTCPQLVEGYSHMTRPALKNRITNLETMLSEVAKFSAVAKTMRKVRVKKPKDASKQVTRLKYQATSNDYGIDSVNPSRIPMAQRLYVFNTKYRTLGVYFASGNAGFEVKGTSLKAFDLATSFITTLRKPKETLNAIMSSTPKQIDKLLDSMKCKKRKGNGRINAQTVLVRVVENRV